MVRSLSVARHLQCFAFSFIRCPLRLGALLSVEAIVMAQVSQDLRLVGFLSSVHSVPAERECVSKSHSVGAT